MSASAVIDGVIQHTSASQIVRFAECERKWFLEKVLRIPQPPPGEAMALGSAIHKELEDYVNGGPPPSYPSARTALLYIPEPGPGIVAERGMVDPFLYTAGIPFTGYIDLTDERDSKHIQIYDYKSKKKLQYAKTNAELSKDIQMVAYAAWAHKKYAAEKYTVHHISISTSNNAVKPSSATLIPEEIDQVMLGIEAVQKRMIHVATLKDEADVKPNFAACEKYKGYPCPYINRCVKGASSALSLLFAKEDPMALSDRLRSIPEVSAPSQERRADEVKGLVQAVGVVPPDAPKIPRVKGKKAKAASPEETVNATPVPVLGTDTGYSLYVNCRPVWKDGTQTQSLEAYTMGLAAAVCEKAGVLDIRLIDCGKGRGYLAALARERPPTGILVGSRSELVSVVVEALAPGARLLVEGSN